MEGLSVKVVEGGGEGADGDDSTGAVFVGEDGDGIAFDLCIFVVEDAFEGIE